MQWSRHFWSIFIAFEVFVCPVLCPKEFKPPLIRAVVGLLSLFCLALFNCIHILHFVSCFILYIFGCLAFSFVLVRPTPDSVSSTNRSWLFGVPGSCKPISSCTSQDYSYRPRCAYALHYICIIVLFCISCAFVLLWCVFCVNAKQRLVISSSTVLVRFVFTFAGILWL